MTAILITSLVERSHLSTGRSLILQSQSSSRCGSPETRHVEGFDSTGTKKRSLFRQH